MKFSYCILAIIVMGLISCNPSSDHVFDENVPLSVGWKLQENLYQDQEQFLSTFTITNSSNANLASNWIIYFNHLPRRITQPDNAPLQITRINGDFFSMRPHSGYQTLEPGDSLEIPFVMEYWAIKQSDAPAGLYFTYVDKKGNEQTPLLIEDYTIAPFPASEKLSRTAVDQYPFPSAAYLFKSYRHHQEIDLAPISLLPTPKRLTYQEGEYILPDTINIESPEPFENEARLLQHYLSQEYQIPVALNAQNGDIVFQNNADLAPEVYDLEISSGGILLQASAASGIFYGIQTLRSILHRYPQGIPECSIHDYPDLNYRGMMLDVSRNFKNKSTVLKFLDWMATYKLNTLHFHLTDDEGWRLEIPGLPELTEIGSKRLHTLDEKENLFPAYGSGPHESLPGSGYYTVQDFQDILDYATKRHITIIPEIDLPGHARAAIQSMKVRNSQTGDTQYLLHDPEDESKYESVQGYTDNVICVCQETTYKFIEKVVAELVKMYSEVNAPLPFVHSGGDEVPEGVWEKSAICEAMMDHTPGYQTVNDLKRYFLERFAGILNTHDIRLAGWQEVAWREGRIAEVFVDDAFLPYVWNTVSGWDGEEIPYRLANAGFEIILCNAPNLYFDISYDKHPAEPGYYWPGFVDEIQSFNMLPFSIYQSSRMDRNGGIIDIHQQDRGKVKLTNGARENIRGIQGHLWGETVKNESQTFYYLFPKLFGLAERAWNASPEWSLESDPEQFDIAYIEALNRYLNHISKHELPRLSRHKIPFRVAPPGGILEEDILFVRARYPTQKVYYTTDGTLPDQQDSLYTQPVRVSGNVLLRAFDQNLASRVVPVD